VSSLGDQIPDFESRFCAATGEDSGCGAAYARPRLIAALDISYTAIVCAGQRWNAAQTWLPDGGDAGIALNPDCTRKEARPVVELDGNALMKGALDPTPDGGAGPTADAKATLRFVPPQPTELADARWFEQFRSDVRVAFRVANDGARLESADLLTTGSRDFQSATLRFEQRDARPVITPVPAESTWMALHVLSAGSDHELGVLSCSFPKSTTTLDVWQIPSSNGVESLAIQDGVDTTSRWTASESAPAWACLPHDAPARRSPTSTGEIHLLPGWYASNAWSVSVPSPALAQSWAVYTTGAVFLGSLGCRQTAGAQRVVAVRLGPASVPGAGKLVTPALYTRYDDGAWASRWSSGTGAPWVCSPGIDGGPGAAARFYTADPGSLDASGGAAFSFSDYTAPFPTAKGKKCNVWSSSPRGAPAPDGLKCPLAQPPWLAFYESYWVAQGCDPGQLSVCE
jgi:hypothetical protein